MRAAQGGGEPDDSKLYVAHLPPTMDDDNLRRLFSTYGVVRPCPSCPH